MKITIVGSGDAFGTGGRAHTCVRVDSGEETIVVDFGSGSLVAWNRLGFSTCDIDALVISHLHGDHFGGLPILLLQCQFIALRTRPLIIYGPPGLKRRLRVMQEVMFPGMNKTDWSYDWQIREIAPDRAPLGITPRFSLETFAVDHVADQIATGVRLTGPDGIFAYSGDTAWTDRLFRIAAGADLFLVECFSGEKTVPKHMNWPRLRSELAQFTAKRIVLTHLGATALALAAEMDAAGVAVAHDGLCFDL